MKTFQELPPRTLFRVPGYDDLFEKTTPNHGKSRGCGLLKKPVRLCRKGSTCEFKPNEMVTTFE
jgi:hypothetical protein